MTSSGNYEKGANRAAGHMRIGMINNSAKFEADRSKRRGVAGVHARAETRRGKGKTRKRLFSLNTVGWLKRVLRRHPHCCPSFL